MSKKKTVYLHIFIWLFAACAKLPLSGALRISDPKYLVSYLFGFLYLMFVFYLFYFFIVPIFLNRKKLTEFLITSLIVVIFMPFVGYLFLYLFRALFDGTFTDFFRGYSLRTHMSGFFPVMTAAISGSFFKVITDWLETMNQKAELDRQKLSVELELLKSKLNPHFLFNTLNNIDSLIRSDSEKASAALIRLSDMMRYLTYETVNRSVPIAKETEHINNMVELYRLRLKNSDLIQFDSACEEDVNISPGIFSPLIENAFKHSTFRNNDQPVIISLSSANRVVTLDISNFFDVNSTPAESSHSGFGISGLRRRLELTYSGRHDLAIEKSKEKFRAKLTIDTNGD
jgi:two-component system, LytTR family, sensor kinase